VIGPSTSGVTLHDQLTLALREQIQSGRFKQGDPFTTERELMERFNVSSTTVRRALQTLVREGYLYRKVGKGTFVRRPQPAGAETPPFGFYEEMESLGRRPSSRVLVVEEVPSEAAVAEKLQIDEGQPVVRTKLVMDADAEPMVLLDTFWNRTVGVEVVKGDMSSTGLYRIMEDRLGIQVAEVEATISARFATEEHGRLLGIAPGSPVLLLERIVYTADGRPVAVSYQVCRSDIYKLRVRMVRQPRRRLERGRIN